MSGLQYNKIQQWNDFEYNRWGIDETLTLEFGIDAEFLIPLGEQYVANEGALEFIITSDETETDRNEANERNTEFIIEVEFDLLTLYADFVDLLPLIPTKFHDSQTLKDYIYDVGLYVGTWLSKTQELSILHDPYRVEEDYIQHLANLIGYEIIRSEPTIDEMRNQVSQAIPWYKIKGSYYSLKYIMQLLNMTVNIYDFYTNDYSTFVKQAWFVGEENENPPGLDSSYYKSPHFGLEVLLNIVYGSGSSEYLFSQVQKEDIYTATERVRPVNTVPHYSILLNPVTNETRNTITVDGNIKTATLIENWITTFLYFDQGFFGGTPDSLAAYNLHEYNNEDNYSIYNNAGDYQGWNFDDGHNFDQVNDAFLNQIIKFKLGNGNKGIDPSTPGFALQNPVIEGIVAEKRILTDVVEFEFTIPENVVQLGLSELGLFFADGTTMVLASTFPDVDKLIDIELRILVQVYKA
jgi:hypothetical protein